VTGYPGGSYSLQVQQGAGLNTGWGVGTNSDPDNGLNLCFQGNTRYNVSGTIYAFQYSLLSPANVSASYPASWTLTGAYINCSDELIPICLCNCSSFDMVTSNVTYDGDVPTFTNNVTFNDIPFETFDDSNSSMTIVFTQHFSADWTLLTVKTDVYADLTNLKLYLGNGTEVPANSSYSLNFEYMVGLQKQDANGNSSTPVLPSETTPTSVYFNINTTGTEGNFSSADLSLGDTYDEFQGNTTISNKNCTAYFDLVPRQEYTTEAYCIQTFSGLTYGLTTGIKSDPTIHVHHPQITVSVPVGEGIGVTEIVGVMIVSALVISIANVRKKRA
jgi:hypothetical protein